MKIEHKDLKVGQMVFIEEPKEGQFYSTQGLDYYDFPPNFIAVRIVDGDYGLSWEPTLSTKVEWRVRRLIKKIKLLLRSY